MTPCIIHHIVGPNTNFVIDRCLKSWQILTDVGFAIKIWDDRTIETFLRSNYSFALNAFINARNHGEAADIARYLIIHHEGGYYVDWDVQLLDPQQFLELSRIHKSGYFIIDPSNGTIASEMFSSIKNNAYLLELTKNIISIYESNLRSNYRTPQYSGPYRMRDALKEFGNIDQNLLEVKSMFAYDYSEIRDMAKKDIIQPMIHYWLHTWM